MICCQTETIFTPGAVVLTTRGRGTVVAVRAAPPSGKFDIGVEDVDGSVSYVTEKALRLAPSQGPLGARRPTSLRRRASGHPLRAAREHGGGDLEATNCRRTAVGPMGAGLDVAGDVVRVCHRDVLVRAGSSTAVVSERTSCFVAATLRVVGRSMRP